MKNCSLKEIMNELKTANTVLLFPHIQMDGDALGSSVALCRTLRAMGKEAHILVDEDVPANIAFLEDGYCTKDKDIIIHPDVCMAVDSSDLSRIEGRRKIFFRGRVTISIDHHITAEPFADLNFIDSHAAATGEIVFHLLQEMGVTPDTKTAEAIYTAIITDTGNFMYSNTTRETHLIVAALFEIGIDHSKISVEIYQNQRPEKVKLTALSFATMEFLIDGKGSIATVTRDMLVESGASYEETEGLVEQMRNISGVEIAALLKEDKDRIKVSMRAKTQGDVAVIARNFGGGGHQKAAGFSLEMDMEKAKKTVETAIVSHIKSMEG